jgi:hypothetical protein
MKSDLINACPRPQSSPSRHPHNAVTFIEAQPVQLAALPAMGAAVVPAIEQL